MTASRTPLTACIITKNEADRIGPCLESVAFCDEIVVIDSGSTDGTQEICRRAGATVLERDWPGWIVQKNRAAETARNDWILSVDADERVDATLQASIEKLCETGLDAPDRPRAYELVRKVRYLGRWLRRGGWYPEWRARLYDRRAVRWGGADLHEHLVVDGTPGRVTDGDLEHHTYRSLGDQVERINRYTTLAAEALCAGGKRRGIWPAILRPPFHFLRTYVFRLGFLDGRPGFVMAAMRAWYVFLKYAKAWELSRDRAARGSR